MGYLADWLEDILDKGKVERRGKNFFFLESNSPNIQLLHFDVLPTRIGNHHGILEFENVQKKYLNEAIERVCKVQEIAIDNYSDILSPAFLLSEYERVIYGQQYEKLAEYQEGERSGRPFKLKYNSKRREIIWRVIREYLNFLEKENRASIYTRRHKLLKDLKGGIHQRMFSHIFVDEFQDCTQADYQIFYGLIKDNNNLVIAGDYAQAVHLGKTADVPREDEVFQGKTKMRARKIIRLEGSYRLPFRISECIRPLSELIKLGSQKEVDIITPYKGSPPGARPIIVYSTDVSQMRVKLHWLFWHFQLFELFDQKPPRLKKITILEKDKELMKELNSKVEDLSETDTILRLKGMEKECIVWSTRAPIEDDEDYVYYVYTILTRTSSVLIIALFPETPQRAYDLLSRLDIERVMFWDKQTENHWKDKVSKI
jgi:DNA helicase-2/ATP-dependent DNA helicase PcrA